MRSRPHKGGHFTKEFQGNADKRFVRVVSRTISWFLGLALLGTLSAFAEECREKPLPTFSVIDFNRSAGTAILRSDVAGADTAPGQIFFVHSPEEITSTKCATLQGVAMFDGKVYQTGPNVTPPRITYGPPESLCREWVAACFIPCQTCSPGVSPAPRVIGARQLRCVGPLIYTRARFTDGTAAAATFAIEPPSELSASECPPLEGYSCQGYQSVLNSHLAVQPSVGQFLNWQESCSGTEQPCDLTAQGTKRVTAVISKPTAAPLYTRTMYTDGTPTSKTLTFSPSPVSSSETCPPVAGYTCHWFPYGQSVRITPSVAPVRFENCTPSTGQTPYCTAMPSASSRVTLYYEKPKLTAIYVRSLKADRTPYGSEPYTGLLVQFPANKRATVNAADCPPLTGYTCFSRIPDWIPEDRIRVLANPNDAEKFVHFEEDCSGREPCEFSGLPPNTFFRKRITAIFGEPGEFKLRLVNASQGKALVTNERGLRTECTVRDCAYAAPEGTRFTAVAQPKAGFKLKEWSGVCTGDNLTCETAASGFAAAVFQEDRDNFKRLNIRLEKETGGESSSVLLSIGNESVEVTSEFSRVIALNTLISLEPRPTPRYRFEYQQNCVGNSGRCNLVMSVANDANDGSTDGVVNVVVRFSRDPALARMVCYQMNISSGCPVGTGISPRPSGTGVSGLMSGYSCYGYPTSTTSVQLTRALGAGDLFDGWSEGCSGTSPTCNVTPADPAIRVTGNFRGAPCCIPEGSNSAGTCCVGTTRCADQYCKTSCGPACVANGSNSAGTCCAGTSRCADNYCRSSCPAACVPNNSNAAGTCCAGTSRCNDNFCRTACSQCVPEGSSSPGNCCGANRCGDGVCRVTCPAPACVPDGAATAGNCCPGTSRCSADNVCRTSCPNACIPNGSSTAGNCCPGTARCNDNFCRTSCSGSCVGNGSNAAGSCCVGTSRCSDNYCRSSCPSSCVVNGSNLPGTCCAGTSRCSDNFCRAVCPAAPTPTCVPLGSTLPGVCCSNYVRCAGSNMCKLTCP